MDLALIVDILGRDRFSPAAQSSIKSMDDLGKHADSVGARIDGALRAAEGGSRLLAVGLTGIVGAAAAAAGAGLKLASDYEQAEVAFTTMLGSGEKAQSFLKDLSNFAANTPFELKNLIPASEKLLAFGFDAQKVIPMMTAIGNAASGMGSGQVGIDRITLALGQMQAKNKVSGDEMLQLAEAGIPAWQILADKIGVTVPQAMKLGEKGAIDSKTAIDALIDGMNAKFPAMMEKQSQTLAGLWSTVQDNASQSLTVVGQEIIKTFDLKPKLQGAIEALTQLTDLLKSDGLVGALGKIFPPESRDTIAAIGGAIAVGLVPALYGAAAGFIAMMAPLVPFLVAGAALGLLAKTIYDNWAPLGDLFTTAGGWLTTLGEVAQKAVTGDFAGAFDQAKSLLTDDVLPALGTLFGQAGDDLVSWVSDNAPKLIDALQDVGSNLLSWVGDTAGSLVAGLGDWAGAFLGWIVPMIPDFLRNLGTLLTNLMGWIADTALPGIVSSLVEWGGAFFGWIGPAIGPMLEAAGGLLGELGGWLIGTALPAIVEHLTQWGTAFLNWVGKDVLPNLGSTLQTISTTIGDWISGTAVPFIVAKAQEIGTAMLTGILAGLGGIKDAVGAKLIEGLNGAIAIARGPQGVDAHSPSKRTADEIGKPMAQGIIGGFMEELTANTANFAASMNKTTAALASSMVLGIQTNTPAAGKQIAVALDKVVDDMRKSGVENWRSLGDDLAGAIHDALIAKTPETRAAALDMMDSLSDTIDEAIRQQHTALAGHQRTLSEANTKGEARQTYGAGAPVALSFTKAMTTDLDKDAQAVDAALSSFVATLQKNQVPEWQAFGAALDEAWMDALLEGTPEAMDRFTAILAEAGKQNAAAIEASKGPARTAIDHFWDAVTEVARGDEMVKAYGDFGSQAVSNLAASISAKTDQEAGGIAAKGANAIQAMLEEARRKGVPGAQAAGVEIMDAWAQAFSSRAPEDIQHVQDLIGEFWSRTEAIDPAKIKLSADSFARSWAQSLAAQGNLDRFGSAGVALMDAAISASTEGGQKAIDRFADTAAHMAGEWKKNLRPEEAATAVAALMAAVKAVTEGGGAEAIAALDSVIATYQTHAEGFKPGQALADWSKSVSDGMTDNKTRLTQAMAAYGSAISSGNAQAAAQAQKDAQSLVGGIIGTIMQKLGPERGAAVIQPFMTAFQNAILDGSEPSIAAFMAMLTTMETQYGIKVSAMTAQAQGAAAGGSVNNSYGGGAGGGAGTGLGNPHDMSSTPGYPPPGYYYPSWIGTAMAIHQTNPTVQPPGLGGGIPWWILGNGSGIFGQMPHFADGVSDFSGGWAIVGEQGPELAHLPSGSSVYPHGSGPGSGGGGMRLHPDDIRALADAMSGLSIQVDRQILGQVVRTDNHYFGQANISRGFGALVNR